MLLSPASSTHQPRTSSHCSGSPCLRASLPGAGKTRRRGDAEPGDPENRVTERDRHEWGFGGGGGGGGGEDSPLFATSRTRRRLSVFQSFCLSFLLSLSLSPWLLLSETV